MDQLKRKLGYGADVSENRGKRELILAYLLTKNVSEAGRLAGYSKKTCQGKIYQIMKSPPVKAVRLRWLRLLELLDRDQV